MLRRFLTGSAGTYPRFHIPCKKHTNHTHSTDCQAYFSGKRAYKAQRYVFFLNPPSFFQAPRGDFRRSLPERQPQGARPASRRCRTCPATGRVATGIGRVATGIGRVVTGIGRVATGIDRAVTGISRVTTGIGRVTTGIGRARMKPADSGACLAGLKKMPNFADSRLTQTSTMGTGYFDFQQFRVRHDRSTMKVGTDAVLLGAWAELSTAGSVLDIGCGCGVIALIAAQRSRATVTGIDIDEASTAQAAENARLSPFADRLHFVTADVRTFAPARRFDCILSNPPFFIEPLLPPDMRKAAAKHTHGLDFGTLINHACRLMADEASLQVVLPANAVQCFSSEAELRGLHAVRRTDIITREGKTAKRVLLHLTNRDIKAGAHVDRLVLTDENGTRSAAYSTLTRALYLKP